ncbi:nuclear lim interactor-interacting factor-like protein [Trypanosoma rangeli]|uniref:Nuclear lim interactor-interacting factor-like protein n=1 Tax=Trypanosoma rangeli TaxID=5698 RepID=A0A422P4K3_TRYRA|nr:nuclear lim interactor-interacting factor-like protein [Trypanosoma rangeli]RNF12657.1 nuclear lim interactor-interacting factor-like protein [Trypanosoma rangeli]|eukprot:RNF12657.1 nuclear lim interactor-interacting factor-like protein [Trypanosoma rangeli]
MSYDAASFFRGISARLSAARQSCSDSGTRRRVEDDDEPQQPVAPPPLSTISSSPVQPQPATCADRAVSATIAANALGTIVSLARSSGIPTYAPAAGDGVGSARLSVHSAQVSGAFMTQVQQGPGPLKRRGSALTGNPILCAGRDVVVGTNGISSDEGGVTEDKEGGNGSNSNTVSSSGSTESEKKLPLHDFVTRRKKIKNMPTNTSPVIAKNHPSLLPPKLPLHEGKKTLILDLDETLVHSSLVQQARHHDLVLNIPVGSGATTVYVAYRPFLRQFIDAIAEHFEVVVFTASVSRYCNAVMNAVDPGGVLGPLRLYREHCSILNGAYVKDLSLLGRDLNQMVIVDNSPVTYLFQQRNAIPIPSWFEDPNDMELKRLLPIVEALARAENVYDVLDDYNAVLQLKQEQMRGGE